MTELAGIDCAWQKPDPAATFAAGFRFVIGYCSRDLSKNLNAAQLAAYRAAGLAVGLVFEDGAGRALEGAAAGAADVALAEQQANAAGYPVDAVLFFAVDQAVTDPGQLAAVRAYAVAFDAATRRPVGVYGSATVVGSLTTPGVRPVRYAWQTAAWSGGVLSPLADVYQRAGHVNWPGSIAGDTAFDEDVVTNPVPLAGGTLTPAGPAPVPAPVTPPAPVVAYSPPPPPPPAPTVASSFRCAQGQTSPGIARMQAFLAHNFPAYAGGLPSTGYYGPMTVGVVREFAHRSGIPTADGTNVGPLIAAALERDGFRG